MNFYVVTKKRVIALFLLILLPYFGLLSAAPLRDQQFIHQQEQQKALEQQLMPPTPDIRLQPPTPLIKKLVFPTETPCFMINQVEVSGQHARLPHWLPLQRLANKAQGKCLGYSGVNILIGFLQQRLVSSGYATARVLAPAQNLSEGKLQLVVIPGTIRNVLLTPESDHYVTLYSAFPAHDGAVLDMRAIEQGLENLQRLPSVQASMQMQPGSQPTESDIVLTWQQKRMWRLGVSLDDSGTSSTGRYQAGATLSVDNPFSLSDLFYLSANHDLSNHGGKGSKNLTAHYSVPLGFWMFGVSANDYNYHQTVAGLYQDYRYSGKSKSIDAQLSRVLHRNENQKTTLSYGIIARTSKNFINDTEIDVQRRRTSAWRLGLNHRHYFSNITLDVGANYQHGTRWFGALPAPEEFQEDRATALSEIWRFNALLDVPFNLQKQNLHYGLQYQSQISNTPLTPQDQFSIGGRWSVRGFDGERTLSADRGWTMRNELGWYLPLPGQETYLGIDYSAINGRGSNDNVGKHLSGGVIGLRGSAWRVGYDLFGGIPFSKPDGFKTSPLTFGFNLNWNY